MDPDVKFQKPNRCCAAPDSQKHVELKETGINEVSLSGACQYVPIAMTHFVQMFI